MLFRFIRFTMAISSISHCIHKISNAEMKKVGLKGSYVPYLAAIARHQESGLTAAELCKICERDKAAVSRVISEMEKKGLVCRSSDDGKMYRIRLFLTEKGKQIVSFVTGRVKAAIEYSVKGLSEENRMIFLQTFQMIADNLSALSEKGVPQE